MHKDTLKNNFKVSPEIQNLWLCSWLACIKRFP